MKRRTNQQRLVAGLTTLALVVTQVPTAAIAEVVNEGQEAAVTTTQTQEEGQVETQTESSDETTVEVVEPEQSAEAEENVAEQTADDAAISLASEPALQVASDQADLTLNLYGGTTTEKALYEALNNKFEKYSKNTRFLSQIILRRFIHSSLVAARRLPAFPASIRSTTGTKQGAALLTRNLAMVTPSAPCR